MAATGPTRYFASAVLAKIMSNTAIPAMSTVWLKMHIGHPGSSGVSNPAVNTIRKQVTFGLGDTVTALVSIHSGAPIQWTAVSTTEEYTYWSLWDASTNGNCLWTGPMTGGAVTAGDNFNVPSGSLILTITIAAA